MATRGSITVKHTDGKYHSVYTHWDSYLSHNGVLLIENYNSQELAEKLVAGGSISSLGKSCELQNGHTFETPIKGLTVYYGRDRGEDGQEPVICNTLKECLEVNSNEYDYLYDGQWLYSVHGSMFNPVEGYKLQDDN